MASDCSEATRRALEPFRHRNIESEAALRDALRNVVMLDSDTGAYHELFRFLLSSSEDMPIKNILPLLLSSSEAGDILSSWLIDRLPADGEHFSTSNLAIKVFTYLFRTIPFLYHFERQVHLDLAHHRAKVEHATVVMEALVRYLHMPSAPDEVDSEDSTSAEGFNVFIKTKQTQKQRKIAQSRPSNIFDETVVKSCGILEVFVPSNVSEARLDLRKLVKELIDIFEYYLKLLRQPTVQKALRMAITDPAEHEQRDSEEQTSGKSDKLSPEGFSDEVREDVSAASLVNQPMKAALYFESVEGFGEWRILISTRASLILQDLRRQGKEAFIPVFKKIKKLSSGCFSADKQKRLAEVNNGVPIYEAEMAKDLILVYQIDCAPEYEGPLEKQVIRIFGLYTRVQIDKRLWESVSYQLGKKGREYRTRCRYRNRPVARNGDEVVTPAYFPPLEAGEEKEQTFVPSFSTELLEEIHSLLVLEKYVTFSQAFLNSIIADLDVVHVFDVSPLEMEIIQHPNSCYVLGRSGTGKTTTMLFKMLGIQRAYEERKDVVVKPRQLFVTQSRVLAGKVEEYFSKLLDSLLTGKKTREELAHMIKSRRQQQLDDGLIDVDDEQNWRADLPLRFSDLRDEHFPLFLTFDRLADLLEEDLRDSADGRNLSLTTMPSSPDMAIPSASNNSRENGLITYEIFLSGYWPHISQNLKKGLDPALVYSELMGVIQGSEESLYHDSRYLSEASYKNLSHRTQYAFSARRDVIYSIFEQYLKRKRQTWGRDAADRTHRLLKAIDLHGVRGQKLDFLYVDEAQDNLLIDALLLRSLVNNPDGLFWAGDTAQTISVGSSFRFNDLKAFLYRFEQRHEQMGAPLTWDPPRTFHLAVNYRSHGGIVDCSHSVIELIMNFWPYAIDVLSREQGVVGGSKPVFYSGQDGQNVQYEQFFLSGGTGAAIEFGAQQCILVRNDTARDDLRRQVGEIGLILTLYESKGLEFDDVLLYKFFEDSTVDSSQWRIVLNMLGNLSKGTPAFDEVKHAGVCSELKFLYVAITRARKNLWIIDNSDKGEPMRTFWSSRNKIRHIIPGTDVPRLAAASSTPEEWAKVGKSLFSNKRYSQAKHCFERAGMPREATVASTYDLRDEARRVVLTGSKQSMIQRREAFLVAARAFLQCAIISYNSKERTNYYQNAGGCFEEANALFEAAESHKSAGDFTRAARLYRKCAKFDEAVEVVTDHRSLIDSDVVENIIDVARLFYLRGGELEKAARLFDSVDEQLEYMEDYDLDVSRAAVLERLGNLQEAADIHLQEGRTFEAIKLLLRDDSDSVAVARGRQCVLTGLWEQISYGCRPAQQFEAVEALLSIAPSPRSTNVPIADELSMFRAIISRDIDSLRTLGRKFESNSITSSILCFEFAFRAFPAVQGMPQAAMSAFLQDYTTYNRLLNNLAKKERLLQDEDIRRLFSIREAAGNGYHLPKGTYIHDKISSSRKVIGRVSDNGIEVGGWELEPRLKAMLLERLAANLTLEVEGCRTARAFSPCLAFLVGNNQCNRADCPHAHIDGAKLSETWYEMQIRIHLQQILLLRGLSSIAVDPLKRIEYIKFWIGRLFDTCYPAIFRMGSFPNVRLSAIPEWAESLGLLRSFCGELLFWDRHDVRDPRLLNMAYQIVRISYHVDKVGAFPVICSSPLTDLLRGNPLYLRQRQDPTTALLPDLGKALLPNHPHAVEFGLICLQHILDKLIPMNANILYDLIETVAGSVILVRNRGNIHNVTMPLSWFNKLLPSIVLDRGSSWTIERSNSQVKTLVSILQLLLERFTKGHQLLHSILFEQSDLRVLGFIRNVFISRLCRVLCLLGYNINNNQLRIDILTMIQTLKETAFNYLVKEFAYALHWNQLTRALHRSFSGSPLDEMVQLFHSSKVINSNPPPRSIRRVVFTNTTDILKIIDGSLTFSSLRPDAPQFVPKPKVQTSADVAEEEPGHEPVADEPEVDSTAIADAAAIVDVPATADASNQVGKPSQEQIDAVITLQQIRRARKPRSRKSRLTKLGVLRRTIFTECLKASDNLGIYRGGFYRLLYLGPLPHLLVALSEVNSWALEHKKQNKARFNTAKHQELEEVKKRMTDHKRIIDEIRLLRKAAEPQAGIHAKRDIEALKKLVLQAHEMIKRVVPSSVADEVSEDMRLAYLGIVQSKNVPRAEERPTLIIQDDGYGV